MKGAKNKNKRYLIGNAHIDPVWLWTWQEGRAEVRSTFAAALQRIAERDGFVFTASSAQYYKWIEETDPGAFALIRQYVREGRWSITGGWWIQPDCNLPCGEALARQGLYGQRYFLSRFGVRAVTGYNVDSFGHSSQLPQLLKQCGMDNYVFSRPAQHEKELPERFIWRGIDGSAVNAYRIPYGYESNSLGELKEKLAKYGADGATGPRMVFFGVGNHGGGPTGEMLAYLDGRLAADHLQYASTDAFFTDAYADKDWPRTEGELQRHAAGCYSAHSAIKKQNRKSEAALLAAEKWAAVAEIGAGLPYEKDSIEGAWLKLLFNHFHDALGGCSIPSVCEDLLRAYGAVRTEAGRISCAAVQKLAAEIDTAKGLDPKTAKQKLGMPVVVFNPLSFETRPTVRIRRLYGGGVFRYAAFAPDGTSASVQAAEGEHLFPDSRDGVFCAKVLPLGYALYYIREAADAPRDSACKAYREEDRIPYRSLTPVYGDYVLENGRLTVRVDARTCAVKSIYGRENAEFLNGSIRAVVSDDSGNDTWAHDVSPGAHIKNNTLGVWASCNEFLGPDIGAFEGMSAEIVESGEMRCVLRCRYAYGASEMTIDYILYEGSGELCADVTLDWREKHKTITLAFPTAAENGTFVCETPYGFTARLSDGKESVGHRWACLYGERGGLYLLNDAKYSFSASGGGLRMVAARSALYADHGGIRRPNGNRPFLDAGTQTFSFALGGFFGEPDFAELTKKAEAFNAPFEISFEGYHAGTRKDTGNFLSVSAENVLVAAVKKAEDGNGYILRAYETAGRETVCTIDFCDAAAALRFAPHEIKTVRFAGYTAAVNILEEPV
ncbi:alpha-mannosidase [Clostridia bacterium]|nr:alpha-mannosidase [Clostridia bacterium]